MQSSTAPLLHTSGGLTSRSAVGKLTGKARYTADVWLPGTLWAKFLTSPHPHARIVSIDTSAARSLPGVHVVLTGRELPRNARFGRRLRDWPVLARERVRFIGDRVAAVAAESPEIAAEAIRLIKVDYQELPALLDPVAALADDAFPLHPEDEARDYEYAGRRRPQQAHPNLQGSVLITKGSEDIERVFNHAHRVFDHTFTTPRQHQGYLEPHACLVWLTEDGRVHVVTTNKSPFPLREQLAACTGLPQEQFVVEPTVIGGDFGGKGLSIDEFACYFLARAAGRPVKSVMSYADELQATNPRHPAHIRLRTAVDQDGRFLAHLADVTFDGGAYAAGKTSPDLVLGGGFQTLAAYYVPVTRLHVQTVYTNSIPGGHVRAPGGVQGGFAGESHVDMIARELGVDSLKLRLLNALRPGDIGPAGRRVREPRAVEVLEALQDACAWGERPLLPGRGRGIALGVRHVGGGNTSLRLRLNPWGSVEVLTGVPDQGSGVHSVISLVAAEVLSIDPSRILVLQGNTDTASVDPGAGASRGTHIEGRAALAGATELKARLEELSAEAMGWPAGKVRLRDDHFHVEDGTGESATFAAVAARICAGGIVEVEGKYDGGHHAPDEPEDFNFVGYMIEVEVDRATGQVRVLDVVLAVDVGRIINPLAHQGQLEGGFVSGLGAALMEELVLQDGRVVGPSLAEYKLPTQVDVPPLRTILVPTAVGPGPFGAKMAGELTNTTVAPAVANAIHDAVGARVTMLPLSAERVLRAIGHTG